MQRIAPVLMIMCAAVGLTACSSTDTPEVVGYAGDYPSYSSVEDLCNEAEIVALVSPLGSDVREVDVAGPAGDTEAENPSLGVDDSAGGGKPTPVLIVQTITTVRVDAVFKGDIKPGSELEVGQPGGVLEDVIYEADSFDFGRSSQSVVFLDVWPNDVPASPLNPTQAAYSVSDGGALVSDGSISGLKELVATSTNSNICK